MTLSAGVSSEKVNAESGAVPLRTASGHRCGEGHQRAKLTAAQVKAMRRMYLDGWGYRLLARHFGCGQSTVRDIVKCRTRVAS